MSDRVWISGETVSESHCYHTDPRCADLAKAGDPKERSLDYCKGSIPECEACSGDKWSHNPMHVRLQKLIQTDVEEVLP